VSVDTKVIERVITIEARPATVFRLLTDGDEYVRWKGQSAQFDARPGGVFRVIFPNQKDIVSGRFVELVPDRRVVFTWGWEGNPLVTPGSSTVEIDLEPHGHNGTRLRLVHRGLPLEGLVGHTEGWDFFLPRLTAVAEGREPGSDSAHHTSAQHQ
jgi:uncharacterized protein YndB with AHSA1/START domain